MYNRAVQIVFAALLLLCLGDVQGLRLAEQKCQEYRKLISSFTSKTSGKVNVTEYVTSPNGIPAKDGEFPHHVHVGRKLFNDDEKTKHMLHCSGALISDRYVLTSGLCIWTMDDNMSLGRHDYTRNSSLPELLIVVSSITFFNLPNPNFDELVNASYTNIELWRLAEPVTFTSHIYPACLWTEDAIPDLQKLTVTGFTAGKRVIDTHETQLTKVPVSRVPIENCTQLFVDEEHFLLHGWPGRSNDDNKKIVGFLRNVSDSLLCVTSSVAVYDGDGGSLLQTLDEESGDVYRLIGVGVRGYGIFEPQRSSRLRLYFDVQKQLDWIESVVWGT
ncbi:CLIP domain-containing serine protease B15-like [Anopheles moucheti]|uniref:CLIP domain-containing serine protease B15-like n=1 Tax=Anopheles moucheti TaxID=186751 RepID=UPI0022F070CF|nr:CLIP domain-containing serine protease B15-like [Anopheles moucheti]